MKQFSASETDVATGYAPFIAANADGVGVYRTQFVLATDGTLVWINNAFGGGGALFCTDDVTGQLVAIFGSLTKFQETYPHGCAQVRLKAVTGNTD